MLMAAAFETKKHPWLYIYEYMTLSAEQRYARTHFYINKYFKITSNKTDHILEWGDFKIALPDDFFSKESSMLSFLTVFFDIIYPNQVRFPIPFIVIEGSYEKFGVRLQEDDYVVDAGAHVGVFSVDASRKIGPQGKVFSFEPIPAINAILKNQTKYTASDNIIANTEALGAKKGATTYRFSDEKTSSSAENSEGESIDVTITTLDDYVKEHKIEKINFIKMDIEGSEIAALTGATETIKRFKPRLSICIYHRPGDPEAIKRLILDMRPDYQHAMTKWKIYAW